MSEKSICRRVRRTLTAARPPRADDPDRFGIATSPECVRDHEHASARRSTKPRNRDSADECCRSGPSSASGSRKTVTASSNETPCFAALASAFRGSHSNTYLVYTKCPPAGPCASRVPVHTESYPVIANRFLCQNCVTYPPKPRCKHRHLRGHVDADRCCGSR